MPRGYERGSLAATVPPGLSGGRNLSGMTQWGLDTLFNPAKRHMDEEKRRLQSTREEIGDSSGGKRIDLESGKVTISRQPRDADEQASDDSAEPTATDPADGDTAETDTAETDTPETDTAET